MKKLTSISALIFWVSAQAMEQTSLETPRRNKSFFIEAYHERDDAKTPYIGVYGKPYVLQPIIGRIKFTPGMLKNAPPEIKQLIPASLKNITFNVIINPAQTKTYNMIFHRWAGNVLNEKLINIYVPMRILAPKGVRPANASSLSFDKLTPEHVYVHYDGPNLADSPNNARFTVSSGHDLSSFWSIALSPDKQNALVTFHLLANTPVMEKTFEDAIKASQILGQLLFTLKRTARTLPRPIDQQTLQDAIKTIETILGEKPLEEQTDVPVEPHLIDALTPLQERLGALQTQLNV